ncbi:uncharacterized protein MONBRDRAFT_31609 [Monosiga brevicollis MX1]|uniref:Uncharacterized protein n=1 Tax=Monosiga brevicollis TaxID=81824 RepID=A9UU94_MONBE|nr:uncharacterized protein MONBRDRAFT_31609 [Monosiga brevicollis MX1]EDQ91382.1 predicted protein [Monosiga brevicollis MX1]|eukprot:XP_001743804.1 hypothetical protein [Monosiga brevicollis MX1]
MGVSTIALAAGVAPLLLATLVRLGGNIGTPIVADDPSRPHIFLIPYVGLAFFPLAFALFRELKSCSCAGPLNAVKNGLCNVAFGAFLLHCFLTFFYGNINNDAWSNSIMIDVIAPPEFFVNMTMVPEEMRLTSDVKLWARKEILDGPHLDIDAIAASKCQRRAYARFMFHEILPQSRIARLLKQGVMFGGVWAQHTSSFAERANVSKVYTDHAYGNDVAFNKYIIRPLWVDRFNIYGDFDHKDLQEKHWTVSSPAPLHEGQHIAYDAKASGQTWNDARFIMDQYSCMAEGMWLESFIGRRFCFRKIMDATETYSMEGTLHHPYLADKDVTYPSGSIDDCDKPYVRAVLTKGLHWTRDTYLC